MLVGIIMIDEKAMELKYNVLMNLYDIEINGEIINYYDDYVFPIGYQTFKHERNIRTKIWIEESHILLRTGGEDRGPATVRIGDIIRAYPENNYVVMVLEGNVVEVYLEMPDDDYAFVFCEIISFLGSEMNMEEVYKAILMEV